MLLEGSSKQHATVNSIIWQVFCQREGHISSQGLGVWYNGYT